MSNSCFLIIAPLVSIIVALAIFILTRWSRESKLSYENRGLESKLAEQSKLHDILETENSQLLEKVLDLQAKYEKSQVIVGQLQGKVRSLSEFVFDPGDGYVRRGAHKYCVSCLLKLKESELVPDDDGLVCSNPQCGLVYLPRGKIIITRSYD